jgi:large subunit ribosomal protein L29
MQAEEARELTEAEMRDKIAELEEERFRLRFRSATETLEDPLRLRWVRREVARMKTIMRERALGAAASPEAAKGKGARTRSRARRGAR